MFSYIVPVYKLLTMSGVNIAKAMCFSRKSLDLPSRGGLTLNRQLFSVSAVTCESLLSRSGNWFQGDTICGITFSALYVLPLSFSSCGGMVEGSRKLALLKQTRLAW